MSDTTCQTSGALFPAKSQSTLAHNDVPCCVYKCVCTSPVHEGVCVSWWVDGWVDLHAVMEEEIKPLPLK